MKNSIIIKLGLLLIVLFGLFQFIYSINVNTCQNIGVSGIYNLTSDTPLNRNGDCFTFSTGNVFFECNGKIIDGDDDNIGNAFETNGNNNITIKNCIINEFAQGVRVDESSSEIWVENISGYSNELGTIVLSSAFNSNFLNINSDTDYYRGIFISSSSYINFTNVNVTNLQFYDSVLLISGSTNNRLINFNINNSIKEGVEIDDSHNNYFENISINVTNANGFYFNSGSSGNLINNSKSIGSGTDFFFSSTVFDNTLDTIISQNGNYGIRFNSNGNNNTVKNSNISSHTSAEITFGSSYGNIFYNNYIESGSTITNDNWNNINYFNSSLSGQNIGNYWGDFGICNQTMTTNGYFVCIDPINYTINTNHVDFAPLYLIPVNEGGSSSSIAGTLFPILNPVTFIFVFFSVMFVLWRN